MSQRRLLLLGSPRLQIDGEEVHIGRRKAIALLAYLAVTGQTHSRDALATLLWPEYDQSSARADLRRTLSLLNRTLGDDWSITDRESASINPSAGIWLDVNAFRRLLAECQSHDHRPTEVCPDCLPLLEQAAELYQDHFLAGFTLRDSLAFDEWQFFQTESLRDQLAGTLVRLTQYHTSQGDFETAVTYARRWVALDLTDEAAHRHLMVLYAQSGQRSAALRQFDTCRDVLSEELGIEPSQRTLETHQRILNGELPLGPSTVEAILERELRTVGECPYRGLATFREADASFFFGREDFTERLYEAVQVRPLVAVIVGSSGSGKSSAVFAGLLPCLRDSDADWLIADFRPGTQPFYALSAVLVPMLDPVLGATDRLVEIRRLSTALNEGQVLLHDVISQALETDGGARRLLLLVDQFEELYTLCQESDVRRQFLDALLEGVKASGKQPEPSFVLLITLRADFMGQALTHRPFADALQEASLIMGPMTRDELRAAIEKPAETQGAAIEAGLVERLLDDVGEEPGNLPLLEFALTLLWERLDYGWMTHAAYDAIGRVEGALARYADEVFAELSKEDQDRARQVFVQLVQPGEGTDDTRRTATRSELGETDANWSLVQHLADKRLVVTGRDTATGNETVEVVHEALIQSWSRLREWMESDRAFRMWQERLRSALRAWQASDGDEGALLRGAPLAEAEGWMAERKGELSPTEMEFIQAGVTLRERRESEREQRRRRLVLALAGGLVLALVLVVLAGLQWQRAEEEVQSRATAEGQALFEAATAEAESHARATAQARAETAEKEALKQASVGLAAQALTELKGASPERGVLLALEALENYPYTPQAESALARAVNESKSYLLLDEPGGFGLATGTAWSPDGRLVAIGGSSTKAVFTLWDSVTGDLVGRVDRQDTCVTHYLAWSPEGDRLVTSTWYPANPDCDALQVWDVKTGSQLMTLSGHQGPPGAVAWSRDGRTILSAGDDGTVRLWDASTGTEHLTIPVLPEAQRDIRFRLVVRDVAWSPEGDRFVTAAQDGTARIWQFTQDPGDAGNPGTAEELVALSNHAGGLTAVAWSPDGERLVTSGEDGTLKVWLGAMGEVAVSVSAHDDEVESVAWSPDGIRLATAGADGTVKVWLADTGREVFTFRGVTAPSRVAWSPDGERLVVRGDNDVRLLDLSQEFPQLVGHTDTVVDAQWSPGGERVATAGQDGSIRIWDVTTGSQLQIFAAYPNGAGFLAWSPDGARIVTTGRQQPARVWDVISGELVLEVPMTNPEGEFYYYANWSPDGSRIVGSSAPHYQAVVFDALSGETITTVTGDSCGFPFAQWSPEGDRFITSCAFAQGDTPARIWDGTTGALLGELESHDGVTNRARWSPDGRRVVAAYENGPIKVYEAESGRPLLTFAGHPNSTCAVAWSPDGARIASGDEDGAIKVWDAATGEEVLSFLAPGSTNRVEWSPDGKHVIVSGAFDVPVVQRAWQSLEELVADAHECCVVRELTEAERQQFGVPPR